MICRNLQGEANHPDLKHGDAAVRCTLCCAHCAATTQATCKFSIRQVYVNWGLASLGCGIWCFFFFTCSDLSSSILALSYLSRHLLRHLVRSAPKSQSQVARWLASVMVEPKLNLGFAARTLTMVLWFVFGSRASALGGHDRPTGVARFGTTQQLKCCSVKLEC